MAMVVAGPPRDGVDLINFAPLNDTQLGHDINSIVTESGLGFATPKGSVANTWQTTTFAPELESLKAKLSLIMIGMARQTSHLINEKTVPVYVTEDKSFEVDLLTFGNQLPTPTGPGGVAGLIQTHRTKRRTQQMLVKTAIEVDEHTIRTQEGQRMLKVTMMHMAGTVTEHMALQSVVKLWYANYAEQQSRANEIPEYNAYQNACNWLRRRLGIAHKSKYGLRTVIDEEAVHMEQRVQSRPTTIIYHETKDVFFRQNPQLVDYDKAGPKGPEFFHDNKPIKSMLGYKHIPVPIAPNQQDDYSVLAKVFCTGNFVPVFLRADEDPESPGVRMYCGDLDVPNKLVFFDDMLEGTPFIRKAKHTDDNVWSVQYAIINAACDALTAFAQGESIPQGVGEFVQAANELHNVIRQLDINACYQAFNVAMFQLGRLTMVEIADDQVGPVQFGLNGGIFEGLDLTNNADVDSCLGMEGAHTYLPETQNIRSLFIAMILVKLKENYGNSLMRLLGRSGAYARMHERVFGQRDAHYKHLLSISLNVPPRADEPIEAVFVLDIPALLNELATQHPHSYRNIRGELIGTFHTVPVQGTVHGDIRKELCVMTAKQYRRNFGWYLCRLADQGIYSGVILTIDGNETAFGALGKPLLAEAPNAPRGMRLFTLEVFTGVHNVDPRRCAAINFTMHNGIKGGVNAEIISLEQSRAFAEQMHYRMPSMAFPSVWAFPAIRSEVRDRNLLHVNGVPPVQNAETMPPDFSHAAYLNRVFRLSGANTDNQFVHRDSNVIARTLFPATHSYRDTNGTWQQVKGDTGHPEVSGTRPVRTFGLDYFPGAV